MQCLRTLNSYDARVQLTSFIGTNLSGTVSFYPLKLMLHHLTYTIQYKYVMTTFNVLVT